MVPQVVEALTVERPGLLRRARLFVDCTVGLGGHAEAVLRADPKALMLCLDADAHALALAQRRITALGWAHRALFLHASYGDLRAALRELPAGWLEHGRIGGGVLLDLGLGSRQLEDASRGFSF